MAWGCISEELPPPICSFDNQKTIVDSHVGCFPAGSDLFHHGFQFVS